MKNALILGLQYGGILVGVTTVAYALGAEIYFGIAFSFLGFLLSKYLIFHFGKTYRDRYHGGFLSFGDLYLPLAVLIFTGYILGIVFQALLMEVLDPDLKRVAMEMGMERTVDIYKMMGMSDQAIDKAMEDAEKTTAMMSTFQYVVSLFGAIFLSAFWAAIYSLILKRERPYDPMTYQSGDQSQTIDHGE